MTKPAAFRATYSDWRLVKTRGVVQVVFEVPLGESNHAYEVLGGMPDASKERWFGIAPLRHDQPQEEDLEQEPSDNIKLIVKERQPWRTLTPTVQCVLRCEQPAFHAFLREAKKERVECDTDAAQVVRKLCGVNSRAALTTTRTAADKWTAIDDEFQAWQRVGA